MAPERRPNGWITLAELSAYIHNGSDGHYPSWRPSPSSTQLRILKRMESTREGPPVLKIRMWFRAEGAFGGTEEEESLYRLEMEGDLVGHGVRTTTIDMGTSAEVPAKAEAIIRDAKAQMDAAGHEDVSVLVDPPNPDDPATTEPMLRDVGHNSV